jgi:hypothetical protein
VVGVVVGWWWVVEGPAATPWWWGWFAAGEPVREAAVAEQSGAGGVVPVGVAAVFAGGHGWA